MSEAPTTYRCIVCSEGHPFPGEPTCHLADLRRISNLEVAVESLKARVMEVRPTQSGVSPQMGGPLVPSEGQCAYPIGGGVVCLLPPGHDGAHGMTWASPAEAAIFERGGYVPPRCVATSCGCGWKGTTEAELLAHMAEVHGMERITPPPPKIDPGASVCERTPDQTERATKPVTRGDRQRLEDVLAARPPVGTPAAMLGEAVKMAHRAESLAFDVFHSPAGPSAAEAIRSARLLLVEAVSALKRAQREAEVGERKR